MSKIAKQDWSLVCSALSAIVLSFTVRQYSEFFGGLMVGLGVATLVLFIVKVIKGSRNQA